MPESKKNITTSFSQKGIFPHKWAFSLLLPLRNIFLSPKTLIKRLHIEENMHILEIGPGPGYFSLKIAQKLTKGRLALTDIQPEMLEYAKRRAKKNNIDNIDYHLCDGSSFPFETGIFDRIFMVTVIGEVDNKDAYFQEFYRLLKRKGILSISELAGDPDKMTIDDVTSLAVKHGFLFHEFFGTKNNYTVNLIKLDV